MAQPLWNEEDEEPEEAGAFTFRRLLDSPEGGRRCWHGLSEGV